MFCPKCGIQNPSEGKFCRACGADLGAVSEALTGSLRPAATAITDRRGRPVSLETAMIKIFTGIAFLLVALYLGYSGLFGAKLWWFWLLIPAFGSLGSGIARYIQVKQQQQAASPVIAPAETANSFRPTPNSPELPPADPRFPAAGSGFVSNSQGYKTGDLAPPSVVETTTRHLELDKEGETMTLPKREGGG
jgi:hypothetical protein